MRGRISNISSTSCFCSSLSGRCAAMVSARRPASSIPAIEVRISGGIFLLSLTYWSNCEITARPQRLRPRDRYRLPQQPARCTATNIRRASIDRLRALGALDQHLHGPVRAV